MTYGEYRDQKRELTRKIKLAQTTLTDAYKQTTLVTTPPMVELARQNWERLTSQLETVELEWERQCSIRRRQ